MTNPADETDVKFLSVLSKSGCLSFQQIVSSKNLGRNRNKAREKLSSLVQRGLVKEEPKERRRGQKLAIVPTKKGKKWLAGKLTEDLKETCENLQALVQSASAPEKVFKWRRAAAWVPRQALERESPTVLRQSELHEMLAHKQTTIRPLWHIVKGLVSILMQIECPIGYTETLSNVEIRFSEAGEPCWIMYPGLGSR